jgi:hypothetical protein
MPPRRAALLLLALAVYGMFLQDCVFLFFFFSFYPLFFLPGRAGDFFGV